MRHWNAFGVFCIGGGVLFWLIIHLRDWKLRRIFNFRKELKRVKEQSVRVPYNPEKDTYIGLTTGKRPVFTADDAKNIFVCGTTGSGKTVALANYIKRAVDMNFSALIIDGKGDTGKGSLLDIVQKLAEKGENRKKCMLLTRQTQANQINITHFAMLLLLLQRIC